VLLSGTCVESKVEAAAVNIQRETLRAYGNVVIVGGNGLRLIRQLAPNFKPSTDITAKAPTGPVIVGTLDGRTVVYDPLQETNRVVVTYKGPNVLNSAIIFCPYIPLFTTPTLITADLHVQKGFMSSAAIHVVNEKMMTYFDITGL